MIPKLKDKVDNNHYHEFRQQVLAYKEKHPLTYNKEDDRYIKPQWVIEKIGELLGDDAFITVDVGQHQFWSAMFYPFSHSKQLISSSGLGTMGFGFPASMGVKMANNDKVSIAISGDGGFMMNIQELTTCVQSDIPIINIILNNAYLGMVRQWQSFFYQERYAEVDLQTQPDFVKVAQAFGGVGYRVRNKEEFTQALNDAIASKKVAIIDVIIDRYENVLPMMPAGSGLNDMMLLDPNDKTKTIEGYPAPARVYIKLTKE